MKVSDNKTHVSKEFLTTHEIQLLSTKKGKEWGVLRINPLGSFEPSKLIKLGGYHYATMQDIQEFA
jgi:hypothetical protein